MPPGLHIWESYVHVEDQSASTLDTENRRFVGQVRRRCKACGLDESTNQWVRR